MPTDFTAITGAVAMTAVVSGIVAMGGIKIVPNATKWAVNKLAGFFGR